MNGYKVKVEKRGGLFIARVEGNGLSAMATGRDETTAMHRVQENVKKLLMRREQQEIYGVVR